VRTGEAEAAGGGEEQDSIPPDMALSHSTRPEEQSRASKSAKQVRGQGQHKARARA